MAVHVERHTHTQTDTRVVGSCAKARYDERDRERERESVLIITLVRGTRSEEMRSPDTTYDKLSVYQQISFPNLPPDIFPLVCPRPLVRARVAAAKPLALSFYLPLSLSLCPVAHMYICTPRKFIRFSLSLSLARICGI